MNYLPISADMAPSCGEDASTWAAFDRDAAHSVIITPEEAGFLMSIGNSQRRPSDEDVARILQDFRASGVQEEDLGEMRQVDDRVRYFIISQVELSPAGYLPS